jgi:hypothetical protein
MDTKLPDIDVARLLKALEKSEPPVTPIGHHRYKDRANEIWDPRDLWEVAVGEREPRRDLAQSERLALACWWWERHELPRLIRHLDVDVTVALTVPCPRHDAPSNVPPEVAWARPCECYRMPHADLPIYRRVPRVRWNERLYDVERKCVRIYRRWPEIRGARRSDKINYGWVERGDDDEASQAVVSWPSRLRDQFLAEDRHDTGDWPDEIGFLWQLGKDVRRGTHREKQLRLRDGRLSPKWITAYADGPARKIVVTADLERLYGQSLALEYERKWQELPHDWPEDWRRWRPFQTPPTRCKLPIPPASVERKQLSVELRDPRNYYLDDPLAAENPDHELKWPKHDIEEASPETEFVEGLKFAAKLGSREIRRALMNDRAAYYVIDGRLSRTPKPQHFYQPKTRVGGGAPLLHRRRVPGALILMDAEPRRTPRSMPGGNADDDSDIWVQEAIRCHTCGCLARGVHCSAAPECWGCMLPSESELKNLKELEARQQRKAAKEARLGNFTKQDVVKALRHFKLPVNDLVIERHMQRRHGRSARRGTQNTNVACARSGARALTAAIEAVE